MRMLLIGLAGFILAAPSAQAQTFSFSYYPSSSDNALTTTEFEKYLNLGRCLCDEARGDEEDAYLWVRIHQDSGSYDGGDVFVFLGDECTSSSVVITDRCYELAVFRHVEFQNADKWVAVPVNRIVNPLTARCSEESGGSTTLYVIVGDRNNDESGSTALSFDTRGEDTPTDVSASGGEGSVTVSWTAPTDNSNILYYDVLCSQDGSPIPGVSSEDKADWISSREICNKELFVGDATDVAEAPDCSIEDSGLNAGTHPSPCYVCYSAPSGTDRVRLSGLDNGTEYAFAVVSVDRHGNVSRVSEVVTATPEETTDFAEHYRDSGGREEGGFCFVATAVYGDYGHPDVVRLRGFRDRILMRSGPGRRFVAWYYRNGRAVALLQDVFPGLGLVARLGLEGLGVLVEPAGPGSRAPEGSAPMGLLLMVATAALARRRRQASRVVQDEASSPGTISVEEVRR